MKHIYGGCFQGQGEAFKTGCLRLGEICYTLRKTRNFCVYLKAMNTYRALKLNIKFHGYVS